MRIQKFIIAAVFSFLTCHTMAQTEQPEKYRKFAVYAGAGPSVFINNLVLFKNDVNSFNWAFSARFMWEPQHSKLSLGIETGYYRLYSVNTQEPKAHITNSSIPIQFVVSMKFSKAFYADWSMGQSVLINKTTPDNVSGDFNSSSWSLSDFSATFGYRFVQKPRLSYAAEIKGFYSSKYENASIAALFIVGFRL